MKRINKRIQILYNGMKTKYVCISKFWFLAFNKLFLKTYQISLSIFTVFTWNDRVKSMKTITQLHWMGTDHAKSQGVAVLL